MDCARSASAGQLAGISVGTTPRKYHSIPRLLMTRAVVVSLTRSSPRYVSYDDGLEARWRNAPLPGRIQNPPLTTDAWSDAPPDDVTRRFQFSEPALTGAAVSLALAGNVVAIPSTVHDPLRPKTTS